MVRLVNGTQVKECLDAFGLVNTDQSDFERTHFPVRISRWRAQNACLSTHQLEGVLHTLPSPLWNLCIDKKYKHSCLFLIIGKTEKFYWLWYIQILKNMNYILLRSINHLVLNREH